MSTDIYYKGLQLPQLRSFCLAATSGNFAAAAQVLGLSRPAVWQQVRALERELKASLLRRRGRSVEITPEGRLLLELVQPHVSGLDSLRRLFEARQSQLHQELTVTSTHHLLSHSLPKPVQEFRRRHPEVQFSLRPRSWTEGVRMVERGRADIGVIPYFPESPRSPYLLYEHLFDLKFMVLAASSHPLARKKRIRPRDLARVPLIVDGDQGALTSLENPNHVMLERVFRLNDLQEPKNVVMDCPLVDLVQKYVALNLGVAALYLDPDAGNAMPGVRVRPLEPRPQDLGVAMIVRKGAHLPPCVQEFQEIARSTLSRKAGRRKG